MSRKLYVGKAGQFAVMAELSWRGYNVSIPEIDKGDDVFVLNDDTGVLSRIQVKTATGRRLSILDGRYRCQFRIRLSHVNNARFPGLHYVLAARIGKVWRFMIFERGVLSDLITQGLGSTADDYQVVTIIYINTQEARSSTLARGTDLSRFISNWSAWPTLTNAAT